MKKKRVRCAKFHLTELSFQFQKELTSNNQAFSELSPYQRSRDKEQNLKMEIHLIWF